MPHDSALPPEYAVKTRELPDLAHHTDVNLPEAYQPRMLHLGGKMLGNAHLFITSRSVINLAGPAEPNVLPHRHKVSQTFLLVSPDNSLTVDSISITSTSSLALPPPCLCRRARCTHRGCCAALAP